MFVASLLTSLFCVIERCQALLALPHSDDKQQLFQCVIGVLDKYYTTRHITYVSLDDDDEHLLKAIHSTTNFTLIARQPAGPMLIPNLGYLIFAGNVLNFTVYFDYLIREARWNPYAQFLLVIKSLEVQELRLVFDELLSHHVINVVVINGTEDAQLYAYNPYDNYACGRYYNTIINYGLCSESTSDLYPNKLITGLRNCNFTASLPHRPPFSTDPMKKEDNSALLGSEEYIITLLSMKEHFTVNFVYNYDGDQFSSVAPNMTAIGPMSMLQKNEVDIIFGGMMMVTSRVEAFSYLCGYHDYKDELRFIVRSASLMPIWKYAYMEFGLEVWFYLLVIFVVYSMIVAFLFRSKDYGKIVLQLLDNLLLHDRSVRASLSVKYILIIWVWFAYLINTFYQSSLVSFTTQPIKEYQVSDENDIIKFGLKPCFNHALRTYLASENENRYLANYHFREEGCQNVGDVLDTISTSEDMFALLPNYVYEYNERKYRNKWGYALIYQLKKPYAKFLFSFYFHKGFPITRSLQLNALRLRENGLSDKSLDDHYHKQRLKQKFSQQPFEARFLFPWYICITGLVTATLTFVFEIIYKYTKTWSST